MESLETSEKPTQTSPSRFGSSANGSPGFLPAATFTFTGGTLPSFRDKVLGEGRKRESEPLPDLLEEKLASVTLIEGDRLKPSICFDETVKKRLKEPWEDALILSVLGLRVGYLALRDRLLRLWKCQGSFDLLELGKGFFLVKFDRVEDWEMVVNGGPWMIFDRYLAVSRWSATFSPATGRVRRTLVWVRLPGLGLMYYEESALRVIASAIGKPVKVDVHTSEIQRGKYARLCVEIDLEQPVVSSVLIDGVWQKVEYEGLHLICTKCGCYGHHSKDCGGKEMGSSDEEKGDKLVPAASAAEAVVEDMGVTGMDDGGELKSDCQGSFPSQPQLGDWVVASPRRRKGGRSSKQAVEQRADALNSAQQQRGPKNSSPIATSGAGIRAKKSQQRNGGNLDVRGKEKGDGAGWSDSQLKASVSVGDSSGVKRPRSAGESGDGLVNSGHLRMLPEENQHGNERSDVDFQDVVADHDAMG